MGDVFPNAASAVNLLFPVGLAVFYLGIIVFVLSLFFRLVRALETIAKKLPAQSSPSDAGHLQQIAERLDAGLRASSGDAR